MAADRQIPTTLSAPPVGGGGALDQIQEEITKLYDHSRLMCTGEAHAAGNYTATVTPALTGSLVDGMGFCFTAPATNTGAATFDLPGVPAKAIVDCDGNALVAGMIRLGGVYELVYDAANDWFVLLGRAKGVIGKRHMFIPRAQMYARTTDGATAGTTESTTNKVMQQTFDFNNATQQFVVFDWVPPLNYDGGTVTARFVWMHPSTTVNFGVCWRIEALALSNDDALDTAYGTAVDTVDTGGTTTDIYLSPESTAITIAGTPADLDLIKFQISRNVAHASDLMGVAAKLIGVILYWNSDGPAEA